jgi:hypothetical protein
MRYEWIMTLDLTDDKKLALAQLFMRTIDGTATRCRRGWRP